jgi:RNA-directed DNA polymerase
MPRPEDEPFAIPKAMVWEAWRRVRANKGAREWTGRTRGVRGDLADNLYRIWNRMSSGPAFRPRSGRWRAPGRTAQGSECWACRRSPTGSRRRSWPCIWGNARTIGFHPDSSGYRPGKSAHNALAACRQRCWKYDWVIDLDVQKFFDTVPWDLVVKAVKAVTDCRWGLLHVKRWLAAPLEHPDGALEQRSKGTPQGSAVSPILANLFMHYAFDSLLARNLPGCPFERYADDAIVHRTSRRQAENVLVRIAARISEVGLGPHPEKTRIVYCKDGRRRAQHEHTSVTFLGYALQAQGARSKDGRCFTGFLPAISPGGAQGQGRRAPPNADPPAHRPVAG